MGCEGNVISICRSMGHPNCIKVKYWKYTSYYWIINNIYDGWDLARMFQWGEDDLHEPKCLDTNFIITALKAKLRLETIDSKIGIPVK